MIQGQYRRSPRGERGLKCRTHEKAYTDNQRRSPRGERGLKLHLESKSKLIDRSLPSRGAWIEIRGWHAPRYEAESLPSRGACIEIPVHGQDAQTVGVAPLAGSVD
mgnify:CR=1 FL=1